MFRIYFRFHGESLPIYFEDALCSYLTARITNGEATNSSAVTTLQRTGSLIECYKYHRRGQSEVVLNRRPSSGFAMLRGFQLPNRGISAMTFCK